jgi:hypothetical protein
VPKAGAWLELVAPKFCVVLVARQEVELKFEIHPKLAELSARLMAVAKSSPWADDIIEPRNYTKNDKYFFILFKLVLFYTKLRQVIASKVAFLRSDGFPSTYLIWIHFQDVLLIVSLLM